MKTASCIYEGRVRHRRFAPVRHDFTYRMFMLYVDLTELASLFRSRWLWSCHRPNLAWFRRGDHLGPQDQPLDESVRDLVANHTGHRPTGAIRLLTHFRYFGLAMNPISLFYCFDNHDRVDAIVAEVTNTPWGEQHSYVLDLRDSGGHSLAASADKELHVSPFLEMDYQYRFHCSFPGESLVVHIENHRRASGGGQPFEATLSMRRRPLNGGTLSRVLCQYPFMTAQVWIGIYWQAFQLWQKKVPVVPHPSAMSSSVDHRPSREMPPF